MKNKEIKELLSKNSKKIIIASITTALIAFSSIFCLNTKQFTNKSFAGIKIEEHDVGTLNKDELHQKIEEILASEISQKKLTLVFNKESFEVTPTDLGVYYDIDEITNEIINYKKSSNILLDSLTRAVLLVNPHNIEYSNKIDMNTLESFLDTLSSNLNIPAVESIATFENDTLTLSDSKPGIGINKDILKNLLFESIEDNFVSQIPLEIPSQPIQPKINPSIKKDFTILGSFYTRLPSLNSDRTTNIRLFSDKLNGTVVAPGEEFSADQTAGRREIRDGYRKAKAFSNGGVVDTVAGGICQVVSTLYNSILYADMEITERHQHSLTVSYIQNGRDATIAKGFKDLKFKNNKRNPIIVQAYITPDGYVKTNIWGIQEDPNKEIKIKVNHIGPKAANAFKETYINGVLTETEALSKDRYK